MRSSRLARGVQGSQQAEECVGAVAAVVGAAGWGVEQQDDLAAALARMRSSKLGAGVLLQHGGGGVG
jgi:nanoRNase/pAp phosphatase (c-di-AMP/oligoRNAs hydrolase)